MSVNRSENNNNNNKINQNTEFKGCQATLANGEKCGEVQTLEILSEFQQLYENKLNKIGKICDCPSSQLKVQMLEEWVRDLREQNTLLVQVVEELEQEASERVSLLEEKLRHSSKTSYEITKTLQEYDAQISLSSQSEDFLQRMMHSQSDINNLIEFIRRVRDEGSWNTEGLHFYSVAHEDLCGSLISAAPDKAGFKQKNVEDSIEKLKLELSRSKERQENFEKESVQREKTIHEQTEQIEKLYNVVEKCASCMPDRQKMLEELQDLRTQLQQKCTEYNKFELSVKDMREALTAEVADKHDSVVTLRRECQLLEERCRQADKQTHFKDDIIKEMRKELKQFRSKSDVEGFKDSDELKKQIDELEQENKDMHKTMLEAQEEMKNLRNLVDQYTNEQEEFENRIWSSISDFQTLYKNVQSNKEDMVTVNLVAYREIHNLDLKLQKSLNCVQKFMDDILHLNTENREQYEMITTLKNKMSGQMSGDNMIVIREIDSSATTLTDSSSESDFIRSLYLLKADVSKLVNFRENHEMLRVKKYFEDYEVSLQEIESKEQLIKNKDEMIKIQNDTLNMAQKELEELREKLVELEEDRDKKTKEVFNLQQALKLNQNTVEELEKALKNAEEKSGNIQQAADLYVETIQLLERSKTKAELEVEQQRITIGNLQEALVNTKQQLEGAQSRGAAEVSVSSGWTSRWTSGGRGGGGMNPSSRTPTRHSVHDV